MSLCISFNLIYYYSSLMLSSTLFKIIFICSSFPYSVLHSPPLPSSSPQVSFSSGALGMIICLCFTDSAWKKTDLFSIIRKSAVVVAPHSFTSSVSPSTPSPPLTLLPSLLLVLPTPAITDFSSLRDLAAIMFYSDASSSPLQEFSVHFADKSGGGGFTLLSEAMHVDVISVVYCDVTVNV